MKKYDWLIVGLGNPGKEYEITRHNAGFIIIDEIAKILNCKINNSMCCSLFSEVLINNEKCILLKPQGFMNNSGYSILQISQYFKVPLTNIIVMHDDINFKIGEIKIRETGSSGGHKGINSVIEFFNTDNFNRIKIGVNNKPEKHIDLKDWVVSKFTQDELISLKTCSYKILDAIELIVSNRIDKAMNKYNGEKVCSNCKNRY